MTIGSPSPAPMPASLASQLDAGRVSFIVTGPPGAGKSSVAHAIAQRLQRAALLDGDIVNELIVSGRVWALGEPADEAARQVQLCNANLCALASNFAEADITPVIDWIVPERDQLDFFLRALAPLPVLLIVLAPRPEICAARNETRPAQDQFFFAGHEALTHDMREAFGEVGWWLDSSDMSLRETVDLIFAHAGGSALAQS